MACDLLLLIIKLSKILTKTVGLFLAVDRYTWYGQIFGRSNKKFQGGLKLLHKAEDDPVIWLESTTNAAFEK